MQCWIASNVQVPWNTAPMDDSVYDTTLEVGFRVFSGTAAGVAFGWAWPVIVPAVAVKYVLAK